MFKLDHVMVEVDEPGKVAGDVATKLALPHAWDLMEGPDYASAGVNFGSLNIEFIKFTKRFGLRDTNYHGFSGIAFETTETLDHCRSHLADQGVKTRIGEDAKAHTTVVVDEENIFPTLFLVKYKFDTTGWKNRLKAEFEQAGGGAFGISDFAGLEISQPAERNFLQGFGITPSTKNRLNFTAKAGFEAVVLDMIPNLEIVITPQTAQV
ncbi:hypothetical protein TH25_13650 [Thalassospira profundimaris]|uniref:Glyoxalase-like domain-containing protein n=1 Tax=Thalassospira profundimaris TaxID=502049 RepID=A0A367X4T8_9PROT|nr:hypothetical protein [Thalassospira profundimaris]RCK48655.1 hypothetical protein TH25_13650 [Thalassospira profundimaris]